MHVRIQEATKRPEDIVLQGRPDAQPTLEATLQKKLASNTEPMSTTTPKAHSAATCPLHGQAKTKQRCTSTRFGRQCTTNVNASPKKKKIHAQPTREHRPRRRDWVAPCLVSSRGETRHQANRQRTCKAVRATTSCAETRRHSSICVNRLKEQRPPANRR